MSGGRHVALVLAAGGSRRLGRPKQLLTRGGETLVHRSARLAAETRPRRLLVVTGSGDAAVVDALRDIDCDVLHNPGWAAGLASSLHAAAPRCSAAGKVLVLVCDQPALELHHLSRLLDGAQAAVSGCAATRHGADALGVPAVVPGTWFADANRLHGDAGFGMRLRSLSRDDVSVLDAPELGIDLDTASDVSRAVRAGMVDAAA